MRKKSAVFSGICLMTSYSLSKGSRPHFNSQRGLWRVTFHRSATATWTGFREQGRGMNYCESNTTVVIKALRGPASVNLENGLYIYCDLNRFWTSFILSPPFLEQFLVPCATKQKHAVFWNVNGFRWCSSFKMTAIISVQDGVALIRVLTSCLITLHRTVPGTHR